MSVKALRTQLLGAIAMVLVATLALGSSTFAWFAINGTVTATGMNFETTVQDNLFIADAAHTDTKIKPEGEFKTTLVETDYSHVIVEPVSTKTGQVFWYSKTNNVNGDGQVKNPEWLDYLTTGLGAATNTTNYANAFSENYGVAKTYNSYGDAKAVGFVDYVYQLKAIAGNDTTLSLSKLELTYADQNSTVVNSSFRAAVFVEEATPASPGVANTGSNYNITASTGDAKQTVASTVAWIFTSSSNDSDALGTNFNTNPGTGAVSNAVVTGTKTVETMSYLNAADITSNPNANKAVFNVTTGTHYYKVVVRIWLEGQDTNCNNSTFAKLDDGRWGLTTSWTLGDASTAKSFLKITESTKTSIDLSTATKTAIKQTINGVTYAELNVAGYWVDDSAEFTAASRVYTIVDGQITEVTHLVTPHVDS